MNLNQFYIPDNSNRILTDKRYKCENETIKFLQWIVGVPLEHESTKGLLSRYSSESMKNNDFKKIEVFQIHVTRNVWSPKIKSEWSIYITVEHLV